ncbi:class I SAM-dependent methyltransferase [Streptomyces boninensis]|uniref:class I SAM-dependent methyltransferase n=1 Tax=Streptomyces boninensis TaxID=2039455 RepID=UPI003B2172DC
MDTTLTPAAAATDHYEHLLAEHYTWMLGGSIRSLARKQAGLLWELGVQPRTEDDAALDLGSGPGPQSLTLAWLGFASVTAVDTSSRLLDELREYAAEAPAIRPVHADLRTAVPQAAAPATAAAIVCMGDTLTHLPDRRDVPALLADCARALRPGGHLVLSYRDLTAAPSGTDRFIPVRSTDDRVLTCFLEEYDADRIMVHDLVHTWSPDGWELHVGSYPKLRLAPAWLAGQCRAAGLRVRHAGAGPRGLQILQAVKPYGRDAV